MEFKRWALGAALLLSAGTLTNCSQIFGEGEGGEGITTAMLVGADGDSANWISHGRTYSEQRYSPLDKVNKQTVGDLGLAWFADMDTARGQEATPLMHDGVLYFTSAWSKVYAHDAATGENRSLDNAWHGAEGFHLLYQRPRLLGQLVGKVLHIVRAAPRVNHAGYVGLLL